MKKKILLLSLLFAFSLASCEAPENNGDVNEVSAGAAYMIRCIFGRREEQFQEVQK